MLDNILTPVCECVSIQHHFVEVSAIVICSLKLRRLVVTGSDLE